MVVDDEKEILNFFDRLLKMKGLGVRVASGGHEALDLMANDEIDVVITDIAMPEMNGFDLTDKIKEKYPQTAVIMMTGRGDADTVRKAAIHGADEYITKPFKREELSMVIERATWKIISKDSVSGSQSI